MSEVIPEPETDEAIQGLWHRFKKSAEPAAREGLILHYSPLVKFVAGRMGWACLATSSRPTSSRTGYLG